MKNNRAPDPTVMPLDRKQWREQLNRSNFVNTYCQYRDWPLNHNFVLRSRHMQS